MTTLRRFDIGWDCETIVDNEMGQYCYAQEVLEIFNRLRLDVERSGVCETCVEESVKIADQLRADVERLKKAVVQAAVDEGRRRLDRIAARDLLERITIVIPGPKCVTCGWEPPSCANVLRQIEEFIRRLEHE
jgi:hypothetical protein